MSSSNPGTPKSSKRKKEPIWDYFTSCELQKKVTCKLCKTEFSSANATFFKGHLLRKHENEYQTYQSFNSEVDADSIDSPKKLKGDSKIKENFVRVLSIPSLPVNVFLRPQMREFLSSLNSNFFVPKSHSTLAKMVCDAEKSVFDRMIVNLNKLCCKPSLTLDVWTDSGLKNSYLGVTIHFVSMQNSSFERYFLGLECIRESHTGEVLKRVTESLLRKYGLSLSNIYKVVTDNGANVVKAFKEDEIQEDEEEYDFDEPIIVEDIDFDAERTAVIIPVDTRQRLSCFAHTLQLVLASFVVEFLGKKTILKRLSVIISHVKMSQRVNEDFKNVSGKSLLSPAKTRWCSWLYVIKRFLEVEIYVKEFAINRRWDYFSDDELQYIQDVYALLDPFCQIMTEIQSEKKVTISHCYVYVKTLFEMCKDTENFHNLQIEIFALSSLLSERFLKYFDNKRNDFEPIYLVASALDPNTVSSLNDLELSTAKSFIKDMIAKEAMSQPSLCSQPSSSSSVVIANEENEHPKRSTLFNYLSKLSNTQQSDRDRASASIRIDTSINAVIEYLIRLDHNLENPTDTIKIWKKVDRGDFDAIKKLALNVLSVPATSAPCERVFSQAGFATRLHRSNTKHEFLNSQLMVHLNQQ